MENTSSELIAFLKANKTKLTVQQYRTIKGQILAGDLDGARRGLDRIMKRRCY